MIIANEKIISDLKFLTEMKREIETLEKGIKEYIGDAERLVKEDGTVLASYEEVTSNRFDVSDFKSGNPTMYDLYLKESKSRRFCIKYKNLI